MSFSEAINRTKAAAETPVGEKATPMTQSRFSPVPVASAQEDEDEEEDGVTLRIPGSFDVEDYDDGGVVMGTGTDAVGVLGDLWRRMQLR